MRDLRRLCYLLARLLGDLQAVGSGRGGRRLVNKAIGRGVVGRLWR